MTAVATFRVWHGLPVKPSRINARKLTYQPIAGIELEPTASLMLFAR